MDRFIGHDLLFRPCSFRRPDAAIGSRAHLEPSAHPLVRMIDRIASSDPPATEPERLRGTSARPSVDDMGEWSFPASDPPATWTWDVDRAPVAAAPTKSVVVGFDGSAAATRALERAAATAGTNGHLVVVTARPTMAASPVTAEPILDAPSRVEQRELLDRGRALLEDRAARAAFVAIDGDPAEALIRVARLEYATLIVVGQTGSGFVTRALLGSTAENVLRHAPCDVLVVA
jgi:nucleotide-binding universal stress UspA family protein